MLNRYDHFWRKSAKLLERVVAVATLAAVLTYGIESAILLFGMDWSITVTFYEFIDRVLIAIIGLELVRMLLFHNVGAVLELLAFVIARKMLHPELTSIDIVLSTTSFVLLMGARHFLMDDYFFDETK